MTNLSLVAIVAAICVAVPLILAFLPIKLYRAVQKRREAAAGKRMEKLDAFCAKLDAMDDHDTDYLDM